MSSIVIGANGAGNHNGKQRSEVVEAHLQLVQLGGIMFSARIEQALLESTYKSYEAQADRYRHFDPPQPVPNDIADKLELYRQKRQNSDGLINRIAQAAIDFYNCFPEYPEFRDQAQTQLNMPLPTHEQLAAAAVQVA